jgi:hypothetical protein
LPAASQAGGAGGGAASRHSSGVCSSPRRVLTAAVSQVTAKHAISGDILLDVPDVLIRDVPPEDLARIDAHAARLGLSRTEYLRRRLRQDAARPVGPVTAADLERFSSRFADLGDPEVMRRAWS